MKDTLPTINYFQAAQQMFAGIPHLVAFYQAEERTFNERMLEQDFAVAQSRDDRSVPWYDQFPEDGILGDVDSDGVFQGMTYDEPDSIALSREVC